MTTALETLRSYVCGEWRQGAGEATTLVNPATEEPIALAPRRTANLAAAARYARERGGPALRAMSFAERGALLERMSRVLQAARETLLDASTDNAGSTRSDGKFDVDGGIGTLAYYAALGAKLGSQRFWVESPAESIVRSPRFAGYHVRTPLRGVSVHINAYNFPVWGMCEKAAVAILAGVPVVTKPATSTALVAYRAMQELAAKAELPDGVLQLVIGGVDELLAALGGGDSIAFTGSADTGAKLKALPAVVTRNVRLNIEADSLNSAVLGSDVGPGSETWGLFLRHVTTEMTQKSGQKCTATRRIFVPEAQLDVVRAALVERLEAIAVGAPDDDRSQMGPLSTKQQLEDAKSGLERLRADGAVTACGGTAREGKGYFLPPTLLVHPRPDEARAVHDHEVFGPVATLMPYGTAAEAGALVARGAGSLVASVYSDDRAFLEEVLAEIAPWSGRVLVGSAKVADTASTPGTVLPACVHGGPGRAGGGEELGGERGLAFYLQRTAVQGDRGLLDRVLGAPKAEDKAAQRPVA